MASISRDPGRCKRILFVGPDKRRRSIRLGKTSLKQAEAFKVKLEALVAARITGSMDNETARWVADLPDDIHGKLASVGLVTARAATVNTTLGMFLDGYLQSRKNLKPNSRLVYGHTRRTLVEFFGPDKPLREVTEQDAQAWRAYLTEQSLSEATVNKRTGNAKVFFNVAVKQKLIESNPFTELESKSIANKSRQYFLERKDAEKILEACPDAQWRLVFALCRYAGLRCPSEVLSLQWSDVNWEQSRILVRSPKTERHEGRESRVIPIFSEVLPHLQDMFDTAKPGTKWVITRYRRANQNLRTQLQRILKRAGLKPWPRLFQNLRASRETELASEYPLHVATAWIGNTARIAERHYLQIPDTYYERAAQKAAQQGAVLSRTEQKVTGDKDSESVDLPLVTATCDSVRNARVETKGIEPSFPRCDRGVLPLHHVPEKSFHSHFSRYGGECQSFFRPA
jgi:integrase